MPRVQTDKDGYVVLRVPVVVRVNLDEWAREYGDDPDDHLKLVADVQQATRDAVDHHLRAVLGLATVEGANGG